MTDINDMIVKVVRLSEINLRRSTSGRQELVKALCNKLDDEIAEAKRKRMEPPIGLQIDTTKITYGNLNNLMSDMRREKLIDESFTVSKRGKELFLVKKSS